MDTSAIIMMIFGLTVVWGGLIVCVTIALKKDAVGGKAVNNHTDSPG